jgi:hypothetical protein
VNGYPFLAIDQDVHGIGYSVYYYREFMAPRTDVKACAVDGVLPTSETIRARRYPFVTEVYVVVRRELPADHPARRLRDWMPGPRGQGIVIESGYVPVLATASAGSRCGFHRPTWMRPGDIESTCIPWDRGELMPGRVVIPCLHAARLIIPPTPPMPPQCSSIYRMFQVCNFEDAPLTNFSRISPQALTTIGVRKSKIFKKSCAPWGSDRVKQGRLRGF